MYTTQQYETAVNLINNLIYHGVRERPNGYVIIIMRRMGINKQTAKALVNKVVLSNQDKMDSNYFYID